MRLELTNDGHLEIIPENRREAFDLGQVVGQARLRFPGGSGGVVMYDGDGGDGLGATFVLDWARTTQKVRRQKEKP